MKYCKINTTCFYSTVNVVRHNAENHSTVAACNGGVRTIEIKQK